MPLTRRAMTWEALSDPWAALHRAARPAAGPFTRPEFLSAWWDAFHDDARLDLQALYAGDALVGVLPLQRREAALAFVGHPDVCDYGDLLAAPGREADVIEAFLAHLDADPAAEVDLHGLPEGSATLALLPPAARARGWTVVAEQEAVCPVVRLAPTWEAYLDTLKGKHRHEVRRKLRNLLDGGAAVDLEVVDDPPAIVEALPLFLRQMVDSRGDKAEFMTEQMATFFHGLVARMAPAGLLRLHFLLVDGQRAAGVLALLGPDRLLLYNSGYDPAARHLSVGMAAKVFCLRDAVDRGLAAVDFLRGAEAYKFQLGGRPSPVTRLRLRR